MVRELLILEEIPALRDIDDGRNDQSLLALFRHLRLNPMESQIHERHGDHFVAQNRPRFQASRLLASFKSK